MDKMDISKFYILSEKLSGATLQAHPVGLNFKEDDNGFDDVIRLLMGDYIDIKFPVIFKQAYGKRLDDIIRTGHAVLFLISDKMKAVLEENALTGWKTFAVKVLDKKGQEIQGYHGLSITGRCGKIDYSKSEIIEKRLVPNAPLGKYYKGLHIGLDKWDGSDFFLPEKYFGTIITSRAAEVLKKNKLTNIRLENLTEIETSDFALQNE
ncbi:hypothetical protein FACS189413_07610 [Bacteroidia bacterium]|nr:hypothetical protein FACS189413_07610 [Bacteroidia bacterium]